MKEYSKEYYQKNREKIRIQQREYYQKNRETIISRKMEQYWKNRGEILTRRTKQYQENPQYYWKNREKFKIYRKLLRLKKIQYLGGKCEGWAEWKSYPGLCDVENIRVLQFHHKNERNKKWKWEPSWKEIKSGKIELLCSNCHSIIHRE